MGVILIVEDERPINDLIKMNLSLVGYECIQVFNGEEALAFIHNEVNHIDLVILDIMLPKYNGLEIVRRMRAAKNQTPVLFLTAKEHMLLKTLARNEGKIITVDALCEALWGDNPFGYENSLNAHVRRVREKIETDPSNPKSLITIKGLGYKLIMRK